MVRAGRGRGFPFALFVEDVVLAALGFARESFVGFVDQLELHCRIWIARVFVRVLCER